MAKHKHLTLSERIEIEIALRYGAGFKEISAVIGKDATTISKEVRGHLVVKEGGSKFNPCKHCLSYKHSRDLCPGCSWKWNKPCASCDSICYKHRKEFKEKIL